MDKNRLEKLKKELRSVSFDEIITETTEQPELKFLKVFDEELYNQEKLSIINKLRKRFDNFTKLLETKLLEVDNQELRELNAKYKKEAEERLNTIVSSKDFRDLCGTIDYLFVQQSETKQAWQEEKNYIATRSGFGTVLKGIFTLGFHTIHHSGKEDLLRREYENTKSELKIKLELYEKNTGKKHSRHDEVL